MKIFCKVKINNSTWSVRRLKPESMNDFYGYTWIIHRAIDLNDKLTSEELPFVIRHEVCHALLDTQGRRFQKKFDLEDLCEFVAWNNEEITRITNEILKKLEVK